MKSVERQLELFRSRQHQLDEDVDMLRSYLGAKQCWQTRAQLCKALDWTDRRLRDAAEHSGGQIIFGQLGMRHIRHASSAEVSACKATLRSQAAKMMARETEIDHAYHSWGGKAVSA